MKRSTMVVVLVLAVIAAAGVYYFHFRAKPQPPQAKLPDLILRMPSDADTIAYADCAALRASPFVARLITLLPAPERSKEYADFVAATGFNYARDLDHLAIATRQRQSNATSLDAFAVAEGRFDRRRIASYLLRTGKLVSQQNGVDAYEIPSSTGKALTVAFLSDERIAISDGFPLASGVNPVSTAFPQAARGRIARVAGSAVFVVAQVPTNKKAFGWASDQLESVRWLMLAAQPQGDSLFLALDAECTSSVSAMNLSVTLEGLSALARASLPKAGDDPSSLLLETFLRDKKITRTDNNVRISVALDPPWLDALAKSAAPPAQKRPAKAR